MMGRRLGFVVVAVLVVVAACGGGVDDAAVDGAVADAAVADASGGESGGTAEGLEATVREIAGLAFTAPAELYDFLSAECTGSVSVTEWVAEAEAAQALLAMMFGDAEIVVASVSTRNVTSTSGEASFSVLINGEDAGGGDSFEPYVFEDGGWKRADCGSLLGGESSSAGFEVDVEASVELDAGDTTTAEPESTENDVLLAAYVWNETSDAVRELQVLLGATPDGNYGPKTRAAHLAELNTRGLSTDNVPDQPDQQPAQPEAASPSVSEPGSESAVSPAPVSGSWTPTCSLEFYSESTWDTGPGFWLSLAPDSAGNWPTPGVEYRVNHFWVGSGSGYITLTDADAEVVFYYFSKWNFDADGNRSPKYSSGDIVEVTIGGYVGERESAQMCYATGSVIAP